MEAFAYIATDSIMADLIDLDKRKSGSLTMLIPPIEVFGTIATE